MQFEVFINFDGNCREALEFYSGVFKTEIQNLMTYAEVPPDDTGYILQESDMDKVMYAGLQFGNMVAMFMDMPSGMPLVKGNNITPTVSMEDKAEVERIFNELSVGGTVNENLGKTFYSELYGGVTDKFGIKWQLLHYVKC
ncbi:MAG: VOC family protein [Oscillospiraceae bacterium]|jgi:PhnB protein|nr:VOC family protein [Oscillospiraceae bacterium]